VFFVQQRAEAEEAKSTLSLPRQACCTGIYFSLQITDLGAVAMMFEVVIEHIWRLHCTL